MLLARAAPGPTALLMPCRTSRTSCTRKDPARHPRDARTAYFIDPKDLLAIGRREAQGYGVDVIYHSHIDTGAYFSATDKQNALMNGEPVLSGRGRTWCVSVMEGQVGRRRRLRLGRRRARLRAHRVRPKP